MAKKAKKMTINIQCRPVLMTVLSVLTAAAVLTVTVTATANAAAGVDANAEAKADANMETGAAPLGVTQNLKSGERSASEKLAKIVERYYQDGLNLNPLEGTAQTGEARFEGELTISISPEHRAKEKALRQRVQAELKSVKQSALSPADKMTVAVLARQLNERLAGEKFPAELMPIDQYGGLPVALAQFGTGQDIQPLKTVKNYQNYLKRLEKLPTWIDQAIVNMKLGIKRGVVQPRALIVSSLPSIKALTETDVEKSPYYLALSIAPESFSKKDKDALALQYRTAIKLRLAPASAKLYAFLENEYLPKTRASAGISAIPNGAAWYAFKFIMRLNLRHLAANPRHFF